MKHEYIMDAVTTDGRKITIYGSFSNCVSAAEHAKNVHPSLKSLTTRLLVNGTPVDSYLIQGLIVSR